MYSGRSQDLIQPVIDDFTAETGIGVKVKWGQSADLALLIDQEGEASPADVFISQSPGAVGFLTERGRLTEIKTEVLDLVPPDFRNAAGRWVGLSGRARVLVYNTQLVGSDELPESVFELTMAAYAGRLGVAPANGSFQDFVTAMRTLHGEDQTLQWLEGLAANDAQIYANNSSIVQAVARGEVDMGLVNHYYNFRLKAEDPSMLSENHYFTRDIGSLVIVTAAGIVAVTDQQNDAERLVEFLLGSSAQQFFATETFEYPLANGESPAIDLPPLEDIEAPVYDFDSLGGGFERSRELIVESGLEAG